MVRGVARTLPPCLVRELVRLPVRQATFPQICRELILVVDLTLPLVASDRHEHPTVHAELDHDPPAEGFDFEPVAHIRKMPNFVSRIGAFSAAEIPSASTRLVSSGSMIPSSQSRAVEWYGFPSCSYLARISSGSASPTIVRTVAACSPPMTEIRAFGHIQSWRGEYARPAIP